MTLDDVANDIVEGLEQLKSIDERNEKLDALAQQLVGPVLMSGDWEGPEEVAAASYALAQAMLRESHRHKVTFDPPQLRDALGG
jgi:hypothetical protein